MSSESFENLSYENRTFLPSQSFIDNANAKSDIYDEADKDHLAFWEKQASRLDWDQKWSQVVDWQYFQKFGKPPHMAFHLDHT